MFWSAALRGVKTVILALQTSPINWTTTSNCCTIFFAGYSGSAGTMLPPITPLTKECFLTLSHFEVTFDAFKAFHVFFLLDCKWIGERKALLFYTGIGSKIKVEIILLVNKTFKWLVESWLINSYLADFDPVLFTRIESNVKIEIILFNTNLWSF